MPLYQSYRDLPKNITDFKDQTFYSAITPVTRCRILFAMTGVAALTAFMTTGNPLSLFRASFIAFPSAGVFVYPEIYNKWIKH